MNITVSVHPFIAPCFLVPTGHASQTAGGFDLSADRLYILRDRVRAGIIYLNRHPGRFDWITPALRSDFSLAHLKYRSLRRYRKRPDRSCFAEMYRFYDTRSDPSYGTNRTPGPISLGLDLEEGCVNQGQQYQALSRFWHVEAIFEDIVRMSASLPRHFFSKDAR